MPELAEVAYYLRQWEPGLKKKILAVTIHENARIFRDTDPLRIQAALPGTIFRCGTSHGKNMLFSFSKGIHLTGHLGMTGKLLVEAADYVPGKHDHLVLHGRSHCLVFTDPRMFGKIDLHEGKSPPAWWLDLPPEILSAEFTTARVEAFLKRRARSPIKALLLDQSVFPGIGNWMADEILWRAAIHPALRPGEASLDNLESARLLRKCTRTVTRAAMRVIAPDWSTPPDSWLFNHRWKKGGNCPRCHSPLLHDTIATRTTCWCPICQPGQ